MKTLPAAKVIQGPWKTDRQAGKLRQVPFIGIIEYAPPYLVCVAADAEAEPTPEADAAGRPKPTTSGMA